MVKIIDDKYKSIRNDIEKVQTKPSMYISYTESRAALHLFKETVNNVIDEYLNPNNISDGHAVIQYDYESNMITVQDTGRGIPFEELENACTILHSGTKMRRDYGNTAGENGVGITVTNALSKVFIITSHRGGQVKRLEFHEGKKVSDTVEKLTGKEKNRHGLTVQFIPSNLYLGKDCMFPVDEADDWMSKLSFSMNPDIELQFDVIKDGQTTTYTYRNTTGIGGFLERFQPTANILKTPVICQGSTSVLEENVPVHEGDTVQIVSKERSIGLGIVINYQSGTTSADATKFSFVNNIETIEHGEHVNAVINGYTAFMKKKIKDSNKKFEQDLINIDIVTGMVVVVFMNTDYSTSLFTSQTKHKMDNRTLNTPIRNLTYQMLEEYFMLPENGKVLQKIIGIIHDNVRARLAATKARTKTKRDRKSFLDTTLIDGYTAPNNIDEPNAYREIYIIEGDGAGTNARDGRVDPDVQGTLGLVGKPTNVYEMPYRQLAKTTKSGVDIKELFDDILGCGFGEHFSLDNLLYDKIILMPDADVDGFHIMGLLCANIFKHAPQLIEAGKVYRALTPLYRLSGYATKNGVNIDSYIYSKDEYFSLYEDKASNFIKLKVNVNDKQYISKDAMRHFLSINRDYFIWLDAMSKQYTLHRDIIEYMAAHSDFRKSIRKFEKELSYDKKNDSITGIYKGNYYNIIIDKIFEDNLAVLTKAIREGNNGIYKYHTYRRTAKSSEMQYVGHLTIGQIMAHCQSYEISIESRYKGLGELTKEEMRALAMDPTKRKLIRLTAEDFEETSNIMDDLFMKDRRGVRKEMLMAMDVSIDDIDN